jgi:hypothetical protein
MTKVILWFALLFGALAIFALLKQPDYNSPKYWKGAPHAVFDTRPSGPRPEPTPNTLMANVIHRVPRPDGPNPTPADQQIAVEWVPVQVDGKDVQMALVLRVEDKTLTIANNGQTYQIKK